MCHSVIYHNRTSSLAFRPDYPFSRFSKLRLSMNHALADLVKYQFYIISVQCVRWLRSVAILCLIFTSLSLVLSGQSMAQSDWSEPVSEWHGRWYVASPSVLGFDPLQLS
ncbi:MAG: hypothetical protein ACJAZ6_002402, partial [Oleispira sp.]